MRRLTFTTALLASCLIALALPEAAQTPAPAQAPVSGYVSVQLDAVGRPGGAVGEGTSTRYQPTGRGSGKAVQSVRW